MNRLFAILMPAALVLGVCLIGCGGGGGGLPDPGLSNVKVETGNARAATITSDGGAITVRGSYGFVYTLTMPAGAVLVDTNIAMYPVKSLTNAPAGATILGGVHFTPEGQKLLSRAKLTIQVPAGTDPKLLVAAAYQGNGDQLHLDMASISGQTITMSVQHFSGKVLGNRQLDQLLHDFVPTNPAQQFQAQMGAANNQANANGQNPTVTFTLILKNWYANVVQPSLTQGGNPVANEQNLLDAYFNYDAWLDAILFAQIVTNNPGFTVDPELTDSEPLAVSFLKNTYKFYNGQCVAHAANSVLTSAPDPNNPFFNASSALIVAVWVKSWHIPDVQNQLDDFTLQSNLCVKPVVESKTYTGVHPGDNGVLTIKAGYSINGGPVKHDVPIKLKLTRGGSAIGSPSNGNTNIQGISNINLTWPLGVDPLVVDILATIFQVNAIGLRIGDQFSTANSTVIHGSVSLTTQASVNALAGFTEITGDLNFPCADSALDPIISLVELGSLRKVGGTITIFRAGFTHLAALTLPSLSEVTGTLQVLSTCSTTIHGGSLTTISLPALTKVGRLDLSNGTPDNLEPLPDTFSAPNLIVDNDFRLNQAPGIKTFTIKGLQPQAVTVNFQACPDLQTLNLGVLNIILDLDIGPGLPSLTAITGSGSVGRDVQFLGTGLSNAAIGAFERSISIGRNAIPDFR